MLSTLAKVRPRRSARKAPDWTKRASAHLRDTLFEVLQESPPDIPPSAPPDIPDIPPDAPRRPSSRPPCSLHSSVTSAPGTELSSPSADSSAMSSPMPSPIASPMASPPASPTTSPTTSPVPSSRSRRKLRQILCWLDVVVLLALLDLSCETLPVQTVLMAAWRLGHHVGHLVGHPIGHPIGHPQLHQIGHQIGHQIKHLAGLAQKKVHGWPPLTALDHLLNQSSHYFKYSFPNLNHSFYDNIFQDFHEFYKTRQFYKLNASLHAPLLFVEQSNSSLFNDTKLWNWNSIQLRLNDFANYTNFTNIKTRYTFDTIGRGLSQGLAVHFANYTHLGTFDNFTHFTYFGNLGNFTNMTYFDNLANFTSSNYFDNLANFTSLTYFDNLANFTNLTYFDNLANFTSSNYFGNIANLSNLGDIGNLGRFTNLTNFGRLSNIGNLTNFTDSANLGSFSNFGNFTNLTDLTNLGDFSNFGNFTNLTDFGNSLSTTLTTDLGNKINVTDIFTDDNPHHLNQVVILLLQELLIVLHILLVAFLTSPFHTTKSQHIIASPFSNVSDDDTPIQNNTPSGKSRSHRDNFVKHVGQPKLLRQFCFLIGDVICIIALRSLRASMAESTDNSDGFLQVREHRFPMGSMAFQAPPQWEIKLDLEFLTIFQTALTFLFVSRVALVCKEWIMHAHPVMRTAGRWFLVWTDFVLSMAVCLIVWRDTCGDLEQTQTKELHSNDPNLEFLCQGRFAVANEWIHRYTEHVLPKLVDFVDKLIPSIWETLGLSEVLTVLHLFLSFIIYVAAKSVPSLSHRPVHLRPPLTLNTRSLVTAEDGDERITKQILQPIFDDTALRCDADQMAKREAQYEQEIQSLHAAMDQYQQDVDILMKSMIMSDKNYKSREMDLILSHRQLISVSTKRHHREIKRLTQSSEEHQDMIASLKESITFITTKAKEKEDQLIQSHLEDVQRLQNEHHQAVQTIKESLEQKQAEIQQLMTSIAESRREHEENDQHAQSQWNQLEQTRMKEMEIRLQQLKDDHAAERQLLQQQAQELENKLARDWKAQIETLRVTLDRAHSEELEMMLAEQDARHEKERRVLEESLKRDHAEELEKRMEELNARHEAECDSLRESLAELHTGELALKLEELDARHKAECDSLNNSLQQAHSNELTKKLEELTARHKAECDSLKASLEKRHAKELAQKLEEVTALYESGSDSLIESLKRMHAEEMTRKLEALDNAHEKQYNSLKESMEKAHEQDVIQKLEEQAARHQLLCDSLKDSLKQAHDEELAQKLNECNARHEAEHDLLRASLSETHLEELSQKLDEQNTKHKAELKSELSALKDSLEKTHKKQLKEALDQKDELHKAECDSLRQSLEVAHSEKLSKALDEQNAKYKAERDLLTKTLEEAHSEELAQKLTENDAYHEKECGALKESLEQAHARDLDQKLSDKDTQHKADCELLKESLGQAHADELSRNLLEKEAQHKAECDSLRQTLEKKYLEQLSQKLDERDTQHKAECDSLRESLEQAHTAELTKALEKEKAEYEAERQALRKSLEQAHIEELAKRLDEKDSEHEAARESLKESMEQIHAEELRKLEICHANERNELKEELDQEVHQLKLALDEKEGHEKKVDTYHAEELAKTMARVKEESAKYDAQVEAHNAECAVLNESIEKYIQEILSLTRSQEETSEQVLELKQTITTIQTESQAQEFLLKQQLEEENSKNVKNQSEIERLTESVEEYMQQIRQMESAVAEASKSKKKLELEKADELERLQAEHNDYVSSLTGQIQQHKQEIESLTTISKAAEVKWEQTVADLSAKHADDLEKLVAGHAEKLDELDRSRQQLVEEAEEAKLALAALRSKKDAEIENCLQQQRQELAKKLTEKDEAHRKEMESVSQAIGEHKDSIAAEVQHLRKVLETAGETLEEREAELVQCHSEEMDNLKENHVKEIEELKQSIILLKEEFNAREAKLLADYSKKIESNDEEHATEMEDMLQSIENCMQEIGALKVSAEEDLGKFEQKEKDLIQRHKEELINMKEKHSNEMEELKQSMSAKEETLRSREEEIANDYTERMKSSEAKHASVVDALNASLRQCKDEIENLRRSAKAAAEDYKAGESQLSQCHAEEWASRDTHRTEHSGSPTVASKEVLVMSNDEEKESAKISMSRAVPSNNNAQISRDSPNGAAVQSDFEEAELKQENLQTDYTKGIESAAESVVIVEGKPPVEENKQADKYSLKASNNNEQHVSELAPLNTSLDQCRTTISQLQQSAKEAAEVFKVKEIELSQCHAEELSALKERHNREIQSFKEAITSVEDELRAREKKLEQKHTEEMQTKERSVEFISACRSLEQYKHEVDKLKHSLSEAETHLETRKIHSNEINEQEMALSRISAEDPLSKAANEIKPLEQGHSEVDEAKPTQENAIIQDERKLERAHGDSKVIESSAIEAELRSKNIEEKTQEVKLLRRSFIEMTNKYNAKEAELKKQQSREDANNKLHAEKVESLKLAMSMSVVDSIKEINTLQKSFDKGDALSREQEEELLLEQSKELGNNYTMYISQIELLNKTIDKRIQEIHMLDNAVKESGEKLEAKEKELIQQHDIEMQKQITCHAKEVESLKQSISLMEARFKLKEEELIRKHSEEMDVMMAQHNARVEWLNKSIDDFKEDVNGLNSSLVEAEEEMEAREAKFNHHLTEALNKCKAEHSEETEDLKQALVAAKDELNAQEDEFVSYHEAEIESLNKSLEQYSQNVEILNNSLSEADAKLIEREAELNELHSVELEKYKANITKEIESLEQALAVAKEDFRTQKEEAMQETAAEYEAETESPNQLLEKHEQDAERLDNSLIEADMNMSKREEELTKKLSAEMAKGETLEITNGYLKLVLAMAAIRYAKEVNSIKVSTESEVGDEETSSCSSQDKSARDQNMNSFNEFLEQKEVEIESLEASVDEAVDAMELREAELVKVHAEEMEKLKAEYTKEIESLTNSLSAALDKLKVKEVELVQTNVEVESNELNFDKKVGERTESLSLSDHESKRKEEKLADNHSKHTQAKMTDRTAEIDALNDSVNALKTELEAKEAVLMKRHEEEMSASKSIYEAELSRLRQSLEAANLSLQEKEERQSAEPDGNDTELLDHHSKQLASNHKSAIVEKGASDSPTAECDKLDVAITDAHSELEKLNNSMALAEDIFAKERDELVRSHFEDLHKKDLEYEAEINSLKVSLQQYKEEIKALKESAKTSTTNVDEHEETSLGPTSLRASLALQKEQIGSLKQQLAEAGEQSKAIEEELVQRHADELAAMDTVHNKEVQSLHRTLEVFRKDIESFKDLHAEEKPNSKATFPKKKTTSTVADTKDPLTRTLQSKAIAESHIAAPSNNLSLIRSGAFSLSREKKVRSFVPFNLKGKPGFNSKGKSSKSNGENAPSKKGKVQNIIQQFESETSKITEDPVYSLSYKLYQATNERDELKKQTEQLQDEINDMKAYPGNRGDAIDLRQLYGQLFREEYESESDDISSESYSHEYLKTGSIGSCSSFGSHDDTLDSSEKRRRVMFSGASSQLSRLSVGGIKRTHRTSITAANAARKQFAMQRSEVDNICNDMREFMRDIRKNLLHKKRKN